MAKSTSSHTNNINILPGDGVTFEQVDQNIRIHATGVPPEPGPSTDTASNVGVGGVGPFKQKTAGNYEFRNTNAGSSRISVTLDAINNEIDIDVVEANLLINNISGTLDISKGGTGGTTTVTGFDNLSPLTTKGDILTHDGTNNIRWPVGTTGQTIFADPSSTSGWKWDDLPPSTGETNTASNAGTGGVGPYDSKVGVDLRFRNMIAGSSKLSVTLNGGLKNIVYDVVEANLTLNNQIGPLNLGTGGTGATTQQGAINAVAGSGTRGDILYYDGVDWLHLGIGMNGDVLTVDTDIPSWQTPGGGPSGASDAEPYVTIGNTSGLSNERALTAGAGISINDNGANTTVDVVNTGVLSINGTAGTYSGSALLTANDTNVLISATGTTASSLLRPITITLSWFGQLSVSRGGTGRSTITPNGVVYGNGTSAVGITTAPSAHTILCGDSAAPFFSPNPWANNSLTIGVPSSTTGILQLYNSGSANATTLLAGAATGALFFTLPTTQGTAGQVLTTTDGAGHLAWSSTAGSPTFTTDTASPISFTNVGTAWTLHIPDAGVGTRGVVTTAAQTFNGPKTFTNTLTGMILDVNVAGNGPVYSRIANTNGSNFAMGYLQVWNGVSSAVLYQTGTGYIGTGTLLDTNTAALQGNGAGGLSIFADNAAGVIRFGTAGFANANERMRIDAVGNVGIGTAQGTIGNAASTKLHLKYNAVFTASTFEVSRVERSSTGTAAPGFGLYESVYLKPGATATSVEAARVTTTWGSGADNATSGTQSASWTLSTAQNGSLVAAVIKNPDRIASTLSATWDSFRHYGGGGGLATTCTVTGGGSITTPTGFNFVSIDQPVINGTTTISYAASLYIKNAPTGNNSSLGGYVSQPYAIWVDDGVCRFDTFQATFGALGPVLAFASAAGEGPSSLTAAGWLKVNSNGTYYWLPLFPD